MTIQITRHLTVEQVDEVIQIVYDAFEKKIDNLEVRADDPEQLFRVLKASARLDQCFFAINDDKVAGVLGIYQDGKNFYFFPWKVLKQEFGFFGALGRKIVEFFSKVRVKKGELYIGGIAVHSNYRGQGIGTKLIERVEEYGLKNGYNHLTLEVVDTNPKAHKLYQRLGFKDEKTRHFGFITEPAGFTAATKMKKILSLST